MDTCTCNESHNNKFLPYLVAGSCSSPVLFHNQYTCKSCINDTSLCNCTYSGITIEQIIPMVAIPLILLVIIICILVYVISSKGAVHGVPNYVHYIL